MRVVLDTNVLIAAFIARGVCTSLLEHCVQQHEIVLSEAILDEFRSHLTGKFRNRPEDADAAVNLLREVAELVTPVELDQPVCRDPDDDVVIATALAGKCRCIVTGDKDLLVLETLQGIDILRPGDFPDYEAA